MSTALSDKFLKSNIAFQTKKEIKNLKYRSIILCAKYKTKWDAFP